MGKVLVFLSLVSVLAWADTLVLTDGTTLEGRLTGVTHAALYFSTSTATLTLPLEGVQRLTLDFQADPKPRLDQRSWSRALGQVQREFTTCRYMRQGLVIMGLVFIGFGQWLNYQGQSLFGNMLIALGSLSILWGLGMSTPNCEVPAARLRTLLWIGLEHGWLY